MKESFKTENLHVDNNTLAGAEKEKEMAQQAVFDAYNKTALAAAKRRLKAAEKAFDLALVSDVEGKQKEIGECKKKIEEINKDKTDGRLGERYGHSVDLVKKRSGNVSERVNVGTFGFSEKADIEVQELEDKIKELEGQTISNGTEKKSKKDSLSVIKNVDLKNGEGDKDSEEKKSEDDEKLDKKEPEEGDENEPEKDENLKSPEILPGDLPQEKDLDEPKKETGEAERIAKRRMRLGAVMTDSIEKNARDIASERMTADKDSLKGVSGFFKKIWKHNWGGERNRIKEIARVKEELANIGSAFSPDDIGGSKDRAIKEAILKRFMEDSPELIHTDAGEWKDTNVSPEKKAQAEIDLQNAVRAFAISTAADDQAELDFKACRDRIYAGLFADKNGSFNALDVADSVLDFAKQMRCRTKHGEAIDATEYDFELTFGEAKTGARTEAKYSWTEGMVKKIMGSPCGRFLNETTLATAVSIVPMLGQSASSMASRAAMGFGAGIFVAGGVAGLKESQAMERDRAEHSRAMAVGRVYDASRAPRREELKSSVYEMISAKATTDNLHNLLYETVGGVERERVLDQNDINIILHQLSNIDARIALSNVEKIDLIGYSEEAMVEVERTNLDLERYNTKKLLRTAFASDPSLGSFDTRLGCLVDARKHELNVDAGGINERDAAFKKIKRTHVWKAVGKGAIVGVVGGLVAQEVGSLINGQDGLVEGIRGTGSGKGTTSLEWAREKILGLFGTYDLSNQGIETILPGKEVVSSAVVGGVTHEAHSTLNSFITLPKGYELNPSGSHAGVYEVFHGGKSIAHVEIDPSTGSPTGASLAELKKAGFDIDTTTNRIVSSATSGASAGIKNMNVEDFAHENADKFAKIKRLGWADNGTVRPDKNELKLWDPTEKNGMYQYQVKMNHSGSVFNGTHIDPVKLASEGKLKALFSLSQSTQGHPVEVPIKFEGGKMFFDVDPKDPILGQLFHKGPNGQIICDARFVEVGAEMGKDANGVKEFVMCATEEGKGLSSIKDTASKVIDSIKTNVKTDISMQKDVYLPPVIPLLPRTPLEPTKSKTIPPPPYYGFQSRPEDLKRWKESQSETLKTNPNAKLDQLKEVDMYFDREEKSSEFGKEYLEELDERIAENKLDSVVTKDTKVVVCMPVHGPSEAENIYQTLSLYSKQDEVSLSKTAFMLNVNWREFEKDSPATRKTFAEIERAKKDFPKLKIGFFGKEWSQDLVVRKNGRLYGTVVKHLNDTVLRLISKKRINEDVYLLTNDADCRGMSSHYLSDVLKAGEKEPEKDGFLGRLEWGTEKFTQYPGYHVSMRVMQYLGAVKRNSKLLKDKYVESSGANFTCKAGTFAAVGGYEASIGAGADTDLGKKIRYARGGEQIDKNPDSNAYPISYVNSAWLDTDPERGLSYYLDGKFIGSMWDDFDGKKGYTPRQGPKAEKDTAESLEDFDTIALRIEFQLNEFVRQWYRDERVFNKALNYLMPPQKGKLAWVNNGDSNNPKITLTQSGKVWLKKQLEDFSTSNKADTKYNKGAGFRS